MTREQRMRRRVGMVLAARGLLLAGIDVRDARGFGHGWQELCGVDHEAVGADEDALAGGWNGFGGD